MKIIKKLDDHGLIRLMPAEESAKEYRSAIGGVRKDELRDRLIMIRMPENSREQCPQEFSKKLAHGTMLAEMQLRPNEAAEASVDDLRDFFHSFAITPERCATNALQGADDGEVFRGWRCFEPGLSGQSVVCCLNTLAMGDGSAVEIAQASHLARPSRGPLRSRRARGLRTTRTTWARVGRTGDRRPRGLPNPRRGC